MRGLRAAALALCIGAAPALADCNGEPGACTVPDGEYHLAMPEAVATPPVVMFLHGAGSTGGNVFRNSALVDGLLARGYAVLAPTGARSFGSGSGRVWNFYPVWDGRDETAFLKRVAADAAEKHGTSPERILLSGFSAGGFMVNYLACAAPDSFAAYAPVAGGFWRPHPETCSGPVRLFHTHGWADRTVPLEGRFLGGGQYQQGDIFAGLEIWRQANACADERPDSASEAGGFWRRKWTACADDSALELALFPGGHSMPAGWTDMVLDWFEAETGD